MDPAGLSLLFDRHRYALAALRDGSCGAIVPVRVDLPPGSHPVALISADGKKITEIYITVRSQWFPLQRLSIPASTLASYDDPRNKADDEKILAALRPPDPVQRWKGNFRLPLHAPKTTRFGQQRIYNGWKHGWHKGTDLGGYEGQAIHCPGGGKVVHVARGLVNGNTVVVSHGFGLGTVCMHMQRTNVRQGQSVPIGQVLGWVGGTGGFAPHLHWECRLHTVPIDPESLLRLPKDWQ